MSVHRGAFHKVIGGRRKKKGPTKRKAKKMLKHGSVHGKRLTGKQKRLFRARAN